MRPHAITDLIMPNALQLAHGVSLGLCSGNSGPLTFNLRTRWNVDR